MSFLSKLLNGKKPSLSDVVDLLQGKEQKQTSRPVSQQPAYTAPRPSYQEPMGEPTPLGRSWGERMPDEPNQFNYPGSYREYFEEIFREDFPELTFYREQNPKSSRASSYTFYRGAQKVLVIELVGQGCDVYLLRRNCEREGMPYLRFWYDHDGWWNARSYVVKRMREAMQG